MSIHDGHRQRLKDRYMKYGLDGFTEVQVLELMLFYGVPRKDTNPIAHELIERFGCLSRVLDAPVSKLMREGNLTQNAAVLLSMIKDVGRCYAVSKTENEVILRSIADCGQYLVSRFHNKKNETVFLLSLDAKLKLLGCREVGEGSVNYASIPIRRVVEMALEDGASSVVLAHNHPSGLALPSGEDIQATRRLAMALSAVEITLADHVVVADGDYVSLVQSGYRFDDCCIY